MSRVDAALEDPAPPGPFAPQETGPDPRTVGDQGKARVDGRARRWDSHRTARRDELTRATRKAVHHGGPDLSMDEIAAAIGTSKSILYRYFGDRSGLQTAVGETVLHDLGDALAQASRDAVTPDQALRAMVTVYLGMISSSPAVYAFVTRGGDVTSATAPMRTLAEDAAALLVPVLAPVLDQAGRPVGLVDVWAAGVIGFVRGAAEVWLVRRVADGGPTGGTARSADADADAGIGAETAAATATEAATAAGADGPDPDLVALAVELTDWLCRGTALATGEPPPATGEPRLTAATT